ncbi:MAG: hemolysin III family protein [Bacteroidota bacterium]
MSLPPIKQIKQYNSDQERANTITHAIGILLTLISIPFLLYQALPLLSAAQLTGLLLFGLSLLMVYSTSTAYHAATQLRLKWLLRKADHICIYFLTAGTHTPFVLLYLNNFWGYVYLASLWTLVLIGIFYKVFFFGRWPKLSLAYYLLLGWMAILIFKPLMDQMPLSGLVWLLLGGVSYTVGTIFYANERLKYSHAIWHLFVLGGSAGHYIALFASVLAFE